MLYCCIAILRGSLIKQQALVTLPLDKEGGRFLKILGKNITRISRIVPKRTILEMNEPCVTLFQKFWALHITQSHVITIFWVRTSILEEPYK